MHKEMFQVFNDMDVFLCYINTIFLTIFNY